jgi:prolyl oligopeptidase family protein
MAGPKKAAFITRRRANEPKTCLRAARIPSRVGWGILPAGCDDSHPTLWKTIVPDGEDVISSISIVGGKLFLSSLHDVVAQTRIFTLDGKQTGEITYPAIGSATNGMVAAERPAACQENDPTCASLEPTARPRRSEGERT